MPEQNPEPSSPESNLAASPQTGHTIRIADEFSTAKRNLPPLAIVVVALTGVVVLAAIFAFLQRAQPQAAGSLDNVAAEAIPNQDACLVALTFTLHNSPAKSLWIKSIEAKLASSAGDQTADAVSAVDFDRYYQGFPSLKINSQPALSPEDKLNPGQQIKRTVIVSFPVTLAAFNQRKSVSIILQPYDQPLPIVLTK